MNYQHARRATEVALALRKGHRRRIRKGLTSSTPYIHHPFLIATHRTFHLDPRSGKVRLSLRPGEWTSFVLPLADYHRAILLQPGTHLKELHLRPTRASVVLEKDTPEPYAPRSLLALDSNESSLDGVEVTPFGTVPVTVPFPEVRVIQQRHFERRRCLGQKKARDRRVARALLGREGRREHARITQRLHRVSKMLVATAQAQRAALVLEKLENLPVKRRAPRATRRRLSSWPRRELHRQLFYKSEERGVPVILVNPRNTSRTCPRCGGIQGRRSRVGARFVCEACGWALDRQVNAGANLARTVLAETRELGGLRVDLDALLKDAVKLLWPSEGIRGARAERTGREIGRPYIA
jgi:putative transposase